MRHGRNAVNDGSADRDTWCTPKWLAEAVGDFDLDPCSNDRSHVNAIYSYRLTDGQDGLKLGTEKWMDGASVRVFCNPPYSVGQVIRWVRAFGHTRFCFLLRFDPSTEWFLELYRKTALVAIPRGRRVNFEAPPGVQASSNVFPHALYYARSEDATPAILRKCIAWRTR